MNEEQLVEEKKGKKRKMSKNKKIIIGSLCSITIIIIALVVIFMILNTNKKPDYYEIAEKISELLEGEATIFDEGADDIEYSYIASAAIYIKEVGERNTGEYAVAVFKFNSSNEAELRINSLEEMYSLLHRKIDGTLLEMSDDLVAFFEGEDYMSFSNGIYVIKINSYYKEQYDTLKKEINAILDKYDKTDLVVSDYNEVKSKWTSKLNDLETTLDEVHEELIATFKQTADEYIALLDNCKGTECEDYLNEILEFEKYTEVTDEIELVKNKYNEVMKEKKEIVKSINSSLTKVEKSLNETEYDKVKEQIETLDDSYYDEYKDNWNKRLDAIDAKVFKKSCKKYKYKDVLRYPDKYLGKKAYWFGVVHQKINSSQYRIGVDCTKYQYIDGYSCDNTIYLYYFGDINLLEDDVVKLWGLIGTPTTYTTVLGSELTIPSLTAEYAQIVE